MSDSAKRVQYLDDWLLWKQHNQGRAAATVDKYRGYILRLFDWLDRQGVEYSRVTRDQLDQFAGIWSHQQGLSPRSRRALVAALRGYYAWLQRQGAVATTPASGLEYPKAGRSLPTAASLRTAETLLMAQDLGTFLGVRNAALLGLLVGGGLRLAELCRLNDTDLLWIQERNKPQRLVVRVKGKGDKQRLVPLPAESRLLLRAYLGHPDLAAIDRTLESGEQVLFVSTNNRNIPEHEYRGERRRLSPRSVQDMIETTGSRLGIARAELHPHALRHLYGTELAEDNVDLLQRQALMGHEDPKTTQIYSHLAHRRLAEVVDKSGPLSKITTPVSDLLREVDGL